MVNSRLSDSGGSRNIQAVLAHLRSNPKIVILLGRLSMLGSESGCNRAMVERVLSQDNQANSRTCEALSAGMFSEPGLTYISIPQAIDSLGLAIVSYAAQTMTVVAISQNLAPPSGLDPFSFSRHAFATSGATAVLAAPHKIEARRALTAGLVHNFGILFSAAAFPEDYKRLASVLQGETTQLQVAERQRLGFDHQDAARLVLPAFGFEPDIVSAAAEHHRAPESLSPLSKCVGMASLMSDQLGSTVGIGSGAPDMDQKAIEAYGFSETQLELAANSVSESISRMSRRQS